MTTLIGRAVKCGYTYPLSFSAGDLKLESETKQDKDENPHRLLNSITPYTFQLDFVDSTHKP